MTTKYMRGGVNVTDAAFVGDDGTTYLAGYPAGCTDEELQALDIVKVIEGPPPPEPPPSVADLAITFGHQITADVDAVYRAVIGERQFEYTEAEAQALAYKTAGYTGTVPPFVASWVTASGKTPTAAADDILAQAGAWRAAAGAMRAARLTHKAQAQAATTYAQLDAVRASWATSIGAIKAALGIG